MMDYFERSYGHVFLSGDDQYLFIKNLGSGKDAVAQLVLRVPTGEFVVRKVDKRLLKESETENEDPEKILFKLQSRTCQDGLPPNVSHLYSAADEPEPPRQGDRKSLYHRVRYYRLYNGGTFSEFWLTCVELNLACPPSVVLTMIEDIAKALDVMYSMKPEFVIHEDLHRGNIFLHWGQNTSKGPSFYVGDFGRSTVGGTRPGNHYGYVADIRLLSLRAEDLLYSGTDTGFQSELRQYLQTVIEPELVRLRNGPITQLPNLTRLLELLSAAPAVTQDLPELLHCLTAPDNCTSFSPLLHDTWQEARLAQNIHGPWHVGEVSTNPSTGKLAIASVSTETYHQPTDPMSHPDDNYSESGCCEIV
jgi:hypothetical protein